MKADEAYNLRFGIIGTGRIVRRFVPECRAVPGTRIAAVYNPHEGSAERFISGLRPEDAGIRPDAISDIDDLWDRVDAVYIASPHETHSEYVRKALEHGRHVLCEKPMSFSEEEAMSLYSRAEKRGLVLYEAVKTAFCPGFMEICDVVSSGRIGRVVDIEASFSRLTPTNMREYEDSAFGGSFTELGSYVLLPVLRLLGTDHRDIRFDTFTLPNGTDGYCKTTIVYENGATATCKTGLSAKTEGELVIAGTKGYIYARAPWWLTSYFEVREENPNAREVHECRFEEAGLRYEIEAFAEAVKDKKEPAESSFQTDAFNANKDPEILRAESVARAGIMERFIKERAQTAQSLYSATRDSVGIWGHRGASYAHPENTIPAFIAAAGVPGIKGIEMDVQRTKDGEIAVFHDETLDRVTEGQTGFLRDYTLSELKGMRMKGSDDPEAVIPTLDEFLEAMKPYCEKNGMLINIELKTSVYRYEGIERQAYDIVRAHGMLRYIVWSSFLADSIRVIKEIDPLAKTGMLGEQMGDIIRNGDKVLCDAYHPYDGGFRDLTPGDMESISASGKPVRAWTGTEPLFVDKAERAMPSFDRRKLAEWGVTDIFTNVPERYL